MSVVTNVLILTCYTPRPIQALLEAGYQDGRYEGSTVAFRDLAQYSGGDSERNPARFWPGKVPHDGVWASAVNHLNRDDLLVWLRGVFESRDASRVIVAVLGESSHCWEFTTLAEGNL